MHFREGVSLLVVTGYLCCPPAQAHRPGATAPASSVVVDSQVDRVRVSVGGGLASFGTGPKLAAVFRAALRRYVTSGNVTIIGADIQSARRPSERDTFVLSVASPHRTYQLTASSRHESATVEYDFRQQMPAYLDTCARQLAEELKEENLEDLQAQARMQATLMLPVTTHIPDTPPPHVP